MEGFKGSNGLGLFFFNNLKKHDQKVFVYDNDNDCSVTFAEILSQSVRTALHLKQMGIGRKDIVSTCSHNQKYSCVPVIAAQFLGAITANFDPSLSPLDTVHLLKLVQPSIIFVSEEALNYMETCINTAGVDTNLVVFGYSKTHTEFTEFLKPHNEEQLFTPVKIENQSDTAMILFSSGTTGLPKGICLSHYGLEFSGAALGEDEEPTKDAGVLLIFATLYWISTNWTLMSAVKSGQAMLVCKKFDAALTWQLIEKYKVTYIFLAPYNGTDCLHAKPKDVDVSSVKKVTTGSCPVHKSLMEGFLKAFPNAKVIQGYSQTEFGDAVCYFDSRSEEEYNMQLLKPLSCGIIRNHVQWKIVDLDTEKVLGPNEEGELRIKSKCMMNGYYKMDSSAAFDSEGFIKSGDIAYYDEDNCMYIKDRIKEMFKYRGWHVLPAIIENIVKLHPAVKDAGVIGIPDEIDGDHPMAVVVLFDEYFNTDPKEIENFVNEKVADSQKLRAGIRIMDSLPKTSTGKLRRNELRKIILKQLKQ